MKSIGTLLVFFWVAASVQAQADPPKKGDPEAPLRVLLLADAATREYQFVRDFLRRRPDKVQLSICLQSAGADTDQGVEPASMLKAFPLLTGTASRRSECDLIIAFDPDWAALSLKQRQTLSHWVKEQGGGLIVVTGPVNSFSLARPGGNDMSAIINLLPVRLLDTRLHGLAVVGIAAPAAGRGITPCWLHFAEGAASIVRLDVGDESADTAWEKFFWNGPGRKAAQRPLYRGFFSYCPVEKLNGEATVLASLVDRDNKDQPFLVTAQRGQGKVVFIASGEFWRLRAYKQEYHEQLWLNLAQHAAGKAGVSVASSWIGLPLYAMQGDKVAVELKLVDDKGKPIAAGAAPTLSVAPPAGSQQGEFTVPLKPRPLPGWFDASVPVTEVGEYKLALNVPGAKSPVSASLRVNRLKSPFEVQILDGALNIRQRALSIRTADWSTSMLRLSVRLSRADKALANEAKFYRDAIDATINERWSPRHVEMQRLMSALPKRKLVDFLATEDESKGLEERLQAMRVRLFGADLAKKPDAIRKLLADWTNAEEMVQSLLERVERDLSDAERDLRINNIREDVTPDNAARLAKIHGEIMKKMRVAGTPVLDANLRCRKAIRELQATGIRPDTMRYAESEFCDAIVRFLNKDLEAAIEAVRAVQKMHERKEFDQALVEKTRTQVMRLRPSDFAGPGIGRLFTELFELEREQAQQTHILMDIRKQLEADLLKQLLDDK
jgi:hypothetical protein